MEKCMKSKDASSKLLQRKLNFDRVDNLKNVFRKCQQDRRNETQK